jgi:hypothetical protein
MNENTNADLIKARNAILRNPPEGGKEFKALGNDRYRMVLPNLRLTFDIDRLRRDRHQLFGELSVRVAGLNNRTLSASDINVSSTRARSETAKFLISSANMRDVNWITLIEEFCQKVLMADREGDQLVDLRSIPRPKKETDDIRVDGISLPRRHPTLIFGDGGSVKSYIALYFAGKMAQAGMKVGLFDWELAGEDHRDRLERLFGPSMPEIYYARCGRPLVFEAERLSREVARIGVEFAIFDSIGYACAGAPESAEAANGYMRAVRQIGIGSLHIAHINRGENSNQKPFGSAFWHNGARSTWFVQREDESANVKHLGLFNRKANLGPLQQAIGYKVVFDDLCTTFMQENVADNPELASQLPVRERIYRALKRGR